MPENFAFTSVLQLADDSAIYAGIDNEDGLYGFAARVQRYSTDIMIVESGIGA